MDSENIKVAWICNFSNAEIQSISHPGFTTNEYAPWITNLAELFENEKSVELHIIAPNKHMAGYKQFTLRNIHYHLFNSNIYLFGYSILDLFNLNIRIKYLFNKAFIRHIIKNIKPCVIHLHGAENPHYSSSIFQFRNKYPVLITIQGFISQSIEKPDICTRTRIEVEKRILSTFKHFGYRTKKMGEDIRSFNPHAILHWHLYPTKIKPIETKKVFDIVFFARVCKDKGMDDLLKALSIIKRKKPNVKLCVIGANSPFYQDMADQLGISDNIYWAGFLPTQADVHKMASAAKISVLPTYHDIIPGTIIESMFLKLPVVAYDVGSIHEVNKSKHIISLVAKGDIPELADTILNLLKDEAALEIKAEKTYRRILEIADYSNTPGDLLDAYKEVIHEFKK